MSSQLPLFKSQWSWVKESLSSSILWALPENCRRSTDPPKRATGVLRHGFIAGICSPAALIFQEFSCSFSWLLQAHWGNSQEKPRDINISYYLILNPTAFCSSHYGFTHFLGCVENFVLLKCRNSEEKTRRLRIGSSAEFLYSMTCVVICSHRRSPLKSFLQGIFIVRIGGGTFLGWDKTSKLRAINLTNPHLARTKSFAE